MADEVEWLVSGARGGDGAEDLPGVDDAFFGPMLDYRPRTATSPLIQADLAPASPALS